MLDLLKYYLDETSGFQALDEFMGRTEQHTLDITYHPPHVERIWYQNGDHRIYLHRLHPCSTAQALWHPHDWPSAVYVVNGKYEHRVGYLPGVERGSVLDKQVKGSKVKLLSTTILTAGSMYEMVDPEALHSVRPLDAPVLTLMVAGKPWPKDQRIQIPKPKVPQGRLSPEVIKELINRFTNAL